MELEIREARPEDAAQIVAVFNPIIETGLYTAFDAPFTEEAERRYIEGLSDRAVFLVAEPVGGPIVGFQSMEPFAAYTRGFDHVGVLGTYVDLAWRRRGVAKRLFAATFEAARRKGYEKIFTYVRADNPTALAAYLGQGFRIVGTARGQLKLGERRIDEVIVERFL